MLRCRQLTVRPGGDPAAAPILDQASASFRPRAMNALIGPSGCGKTTLVKAMLGLVPVDTGGEVWLERVQIAQPEDLLGRVGFAPQFSIAQPKLQVEECLRFALEICVADAVMRRERLEHVLEVIGLAEHRNKRVESLSGGQLRRLGLGLELTLDPQMLVCDEVTSGLDPVSENAILDLLRGLSRTRGKTLLCIIHNLAKLDYFDWITVVNTGEVVFQGTKAELHEHFEVADALYLYEALNAQPREHWRERWASLRDRRASPPAPMDASPPTDESETNSSDDEAEPSATAASPAMLRQLGTLLRRRTVLLLRDYGSLSLLLAITFGFPVMVVIFALNGLPQIAAPPLEPQGPMADLAAKVQYAQDAAHSASLVTGLIMFQVILLTLMGANNGSREIAAERLLYEKERLTGLRPSAYTASKLIFTGLLAAAQGMWMTAFVKIICQFPGPWLPQLVVFALSCLAMTWVCLAFSALLSTPEKASTLSIYLVGFQLPLSGVVLALPVYLVWVCRPFINAYWGWAGYFSTLVETPFYTHYTKTNHDAVVADALVAGSVLIAHALIGAGLTYWGCRRRRWDA